MAIGINWAEVWGPVWKDVWATTYVEPPPPAPAPAPSTGAGGGGAGRRRAADAAREALLRRQKDAVIAAMMLVVCGALDE